MNNKILLFGLILALIMSIALIWKEKNHDFIQPVDKVDSLLNVSDTLYDYNSDSLHHFLQDNDSLTTLALKVVSDSSDSAETSIYDSLKTIEL